IGVLLLASVCFFDELATGFPSVGADRLHDEIHASHTVLALVVLVAPQVTAILVEAPLLLAAERSRRGRALAIALAGMGCAMAACAFAPSVLLFALAYAAYGPASGIACGLAQSSLVEASGDEQERAMAQWTFAGAVGDLLAPAAVWAAGATIGW